MTSGIFELAIVILIAAGLGIAAKLLKQPIILAYIISGVVIGYFGFFHLNNKEIFRVFSDLGIMFLLFLIGLEINFTSLRLVGKTALIVGLAQIIFTFIFGFLIALLFNFSLLHSAYIAIALTFSSTIIVVKLLSEKRDTNSLYGKISIGFLLVQDFIAILLLVLLSGIEKGQGLVFDNVFLTFVKGAILFSLMLWLGRRIFPLIFDKIARSQELLFLSSLAWCFLVAAAVSHPKVGFSIEIGGFLAGLALANSSEHFQISSRIKSLRDFFILIFFVILGSSLVFSDFSGITSLAVIVFSLFVLIGNPLIVLTIMGLMGYRKRTGFLAGVTVAQISEFSLILAAFGIRLGHLTEQVASLITAVGVITIALSSYLIIYADRIFKYLSRYLAIFERRSARKEPALKIGFHKPIILVGSHRTGQSIAYHIAKEKLLIIDFDPEVIAELRRAKYDYLFGDIADEEVLEQANIDNARLVISTSPNFEDNLALLNKINQIKKNKKGAEAKVVLRAQDEEEALFLYSQGVDYVLLPHFTSGQYLGRVIGVDPELKHLEALKKRDLVLLRKINHQY